MSDALLTLAGRMSAGNVLGIIETAAPVLALLVFGYTFHPGRPVRRI